MLSEVGLSITSSAVCPGRGTAGSSRTVTASGAGASMVVWEGTLHAASSAAAQAANGPTNGKPRRTGSSTGAWGSTRRTPRQVPGEGERDACKTGKEGPRFGLPIDLTAGARDVPEAGLRTP